MVLKTVSDCLIRVDPFATPIVSSYLGTQNGRPAYQILWIEGQAWRFSATFVFGVRRPYWRQSSCSCGPMVWQRRVSPVPVWTCSWLDGQIRSHVVETRQIRSAVWLLDGGYRFGSIVRRKGRQNATTRMKPKWIKRWSLKGGEKSFFLHNVMNPVKVEREEEWRWR